MAEADKSQSTQDLIEMGQALSDRAKKEVPIEGKSNAIEVETEMPMEEKPKHTEVETEISMEEKPKHTEVETVIPMEEKPKHTEAKPEIPLEGRNLTHIQVKADETPKKEFDHNDFAGKKTMSQGVLDIALIATTTAHLKFIWDLYLHGATPNYFIWLNILLISSLILQIFTGFLIIYMKSRFDLKELKDRADKALNVNDLITVCVMMITIANIIIAAFIGTASIENLAN